MMISDSGLLLGATMYLTARNEKNSACLVGGPLLVGRSGALPPPPLIQPIYGAERSKSQMSRAERWAGLP